MKTTITTTTLSARTPTKRTPIPTLKQLTTTAELTKSTVNSESTFTIIAITTSPIREGKRETVTAYKPGNNLHKPNFASKVATASKIVSSLHIHSNSSRERVVVVKTAPSLQILDSNVEYGNHTKQSDLEKKSTTYVNTLNDTIIASALISSNSTNNSTFQSETYLLLMLSCLHIISIKIKFIG